MGRELLMTGFLKYMRRREEGMERSMIWVMRELLLPRSSQFMHWASATIHLKAMGGQSELPFCFHANLVMGWRKEASGIPMILARHLGWSHMYGEER